MTISDTKLYGVWEAMKARCYNKNNKYYYNYGGRGIGVCPEWLNDSKSFMDWGMKSGYKEGLTIDRIDNDGDYCPNNCRWVDRRTQQRNRRANIVVNYKGVSKCVAEWCEELKISRKAIDHCISRYGLSYQQAFDRYTKQFYNRVLNVWEDK